MASVSFTLAASGDTSSVYTTDTMATMGRTTQVPVRIGKLSTTTWLSVVTLAVYASGSGETVADATMVARISPTAGGWVDTVELPAGYSLVATIQDADWVSGTSVLVRIG